MSTWRKFKYPDLYDTIGEIPVDGLEIFDIPAEIRTKRERVSFLATVRNYALGYKIYLRPHGRKLYVLRVE